MDGLFMTDQTMTNEPRDNGVNETPIASLLDQINTRLNRHSVTVTTAETPATEDYLWLHATLDVTQRSTMATFRVWAETDPREDVVTYLHPQHRNHERAGTIGHDSIVDLVDNEVKVRLVSGRLEEPRSWFSSNSQCARATDCILRITHQALTETPEELVNALETIVTAMLDGSNDYTDTDVTKTFLTVSRELLGHNRNAKKLYDEVLMGLMSDSSRSGSALDAIAMSGVTMDTAIRAVNIYLGLDSTPDSIREASDRERAGLPFWFRDSGLKDACDKYAATQGDTPCQDVVRGTGDLYLVAATSN